MVLDPLDLIRIVPDFPKPGIRFFDLMPVLADGPSFRRLIQNLAEQVSETGGDSPKFVAGIEARGFLLGAPLATSLGSGFIPIRKAGKLPGAVDRAEYALEYGTGVLEMQKTPSLSGASVIVVDDILATGGTLFAALKLLESAGARVKLILVTLDLAFLGGSERLRSSGYPLFAQKVITHE